MKAAWGWLLVAVGPWLLVAVAGCGATGDLPSAPQRQGSVATPGPSAVFPPPASDDAPPPTPDPTREVQGEVIYVRECAACHGRYGEGNPEWKVPLPDGGLRPPPHDATGHTWHHPDTDLARIVAEGSLVVAPDSRMPAFGDRLTEAEVASVLAYIKTLWGDAERVYQWERSLERDRWEGAGATP